MARSLPQRIGMLLGAVAGLLVVAVLLGLVYLTTADLGRHRSRIERRLSGMLGVEVRSGSLRIELALRGASLVEARDVVLRDGATGTVVLGIEHLVARVDLLPLFERAVHVRDLQVHGARVSLPLAQKQAEPVAVEDERSGKLAAMPSIVIDRALFVASRLSLERPRPLVLDVGRLELRTNHSRALDLALEGKLDGRPIDLAGTIGPLDELLRAGGVRSNLRLEVAGLDATAVASVADLASLRELRATVAVTGDDLDETARALGLAALGAGPIELHADIGPEDEATAIDLRASLDGLAATVSGRLDSLVEPTSCELTAAVEGSSLARAGRLGRIGRLPDRPFRAKGRVVWDRSRVTVDALRLEVGDHRLEVAGTVGAPPTFDGTSLRADGAGPDAAEIGVLFGLELPALPYHAAGRIGRTGGRIVTDAVEASIGESRIEIDGSFGDSPSRGDTDLTLAARGPSLAPFRTLVGRNLPDEPFELETTIRSRDDLLEIDHARVRIGASEAQISGVVSQWTGEAEARGHVRVAGDRLAALAWLMNREGLPPSPFRLESAVELIGRELHLDECLASVGSVEMALSGRIVLRDGGAGTAVDLRALGPDASEAGALLGVEDLPRAPFAIESNVGIEPDAVRLERLELRVGEVDALAHGRITTADGHEGSTLALTATGPRLLELHSVTGATGLPDAPFSFAGTVGVEGGNYRLEGVTLSVGDHTLRLDGSISPADRLVGSDLTVALAGHSLRELGALAAPHVEVPDLPADPYTLEGSVHVVHEGYDLRAIDVTLGAVRATLDGRLGSGPALRGSDLRIGCGGPDASRLASITDLALPEAPFGISGRVIRLDGGTTLDDLSLQVGEHRLWLDGTLGEAPHFAGADLHFRGEGPDLSLLGPRASRFEDAGGWRIAGRARESTRGVRVEGLELRLGASDLGGELALDLEGRPRLEGRLVSDRVDLSRFFAADTDEPPVREAGTSEQVVEAAELLFDEEPFDLSALERIDADVSWHITRLEGPWAQSVGLDLTARLAAGALRVGPFEADAPAGRLRGSLRIEPRDGEHEVELDLDVDATRPGQTGSTGDEPGSAPGTHIEMRTSLLARGRSPRQLAASASGVAALFLEGGVVDDSLLRLSLFDAVRGIVALINPFDTKSSEPAQLECAAFLLQVDDGIAVLEPAAVRTDHLTLAGHGTVDLATERIDLEWVAKPRKGVGLSATTITNPYIKLGGTLTRPRVGVKPVEAIATTGAAVATAGLTLLGKGLWDRVTAGRDLCRKTRQAAERRLEEGSREPALERARAPVGAARSGQPSDLPESPTDCKIVSGCGGRSEPPTAR